MAREVPAYANGPRFLSGNGSERMGNSDEDASWVHRSAISTPKGWGYYGFKLNAAVCTAMDLPVAWDVDTASVSESIVATDLLDVALGRGFRPTTCALDKGYDMPRSYDGCEQRGVHPIIPLKETNGVKGGEASAPVVQARDVEVRCLRRQARSGQVPLPQGRVLPGERLDQG